MSAPLLNGKLRPISGGSAQAVSAQLGKGRRAFKPVPLSVRGVQALKKGVKKCLWDGMKWSPIPDGSELLSTEKPEALVKPLQELQPAKENDGNTLLGNRFLCRGGGLLFVGSSGIGKSTAVVQMGICWAVGRECFGIQPPQPLKILYVQAENDEGDLSEMRDGVNNGLNLS